MQWSQHSGFLTRLLRDRAGNTLAIMAAMVLPLLAFAGCAVDITRMYVVKSRLQQACDAGVLAGRRTMTDASLSNTTLDSNATAQAKAFFNNNFSSGWFTSESAMFTPRKTSDAQVAATATTVVPMTLMAIFGKSATSISVTCQANYEIADTDILFVLDTTGSMACLPSDSTSTCTNYANSAAKIAYPRPSDSMSGNDSMPGYSGTTGYYVQEKSGSRIAALRTAVLNFYDTMKANVDSTTHVRYGFVTYTSTVNAGKAIVSISPAYMIGGAGNSTKSMMYQSRVQTGDSTSISSKEYRNVTQSACNGYASPKSYNSSGTGTSATSSFTPAKGRDSSYCTVTTTTYTPQWAYKAQSHDVSSFVAGNTVKDPTKVTGATSAWLGCVEERKTTAGASSFSISNLPFDLDPDLVPSSADTSWRPMWPDVEYARYNYRGTGQATSTGDVPDHPNLNDPDELKAGFVSSSRALVTPFW
jgi:Flp pilus assembly protein TadG